MEYAILWISLYAIFMTVALVKVTLDHRKMLKARDNINATMHENVEKALAIIGGLNKDHAVLKELAADWERVAMDNRRIILTERMSDTKERFVFVKDEPPVPQDHRIDGEGELEEIMAAKPRA